jgi:hypothetical protein
MKRLALAAWLLAVAAPAAFGQASAGAVHKAQHSHRKPVALGISGTPSQYSLLRSKHLPLTVHATWEPWSVGRSPGPVLAEDRALHAVPFINWEPDDAADPSSASYSLPAILTGKFAYYITTWAQTIKAYRKPVYLRFAHEMNGNWYPWSTYGPAVYVKAWRYVWTIFHHVGATNAQFVWSPDGLIGDEPLKWQEGVVQWYPGSHYVNYVGMSTVIFENLAHYGFGYVMERLGFLHFVFHKPMVLPEMKVAYADRYAWLRGLAQALRTDPWLGMVIWSETPSRAQEFGQPGTGEMDWSLANDPLALALLAKATR